MLRVRTLLAAAASVGLAAFLSACSSGSHGIVPVTASQPGNVDVASVRGAAGTGVTGFVYVANFSNNSVTGLAIHHDGSLTTVAGSPFATGQYPVGVTVDPKGKYLYVTNAGFQSNSVSAFSINAQTGALTQVSGSPFPTGAEPYWMAIDASSSGEYAYTANVSDHSISGFKIDPATGALSAVAGSPFATPGGAHSLAIQVGGHYLYAPTSVSSAGYVAGFSIKGATGALVPVPGSPFAAGSNPYGIVATSKYVYTANEFSNNISAYAIARRGKLTPVSGSPFSLSSGPLYLTTDPQGRFLYVVGGGQLLWGFSIASGGSLTAMPGSPFQTGSFPEGVVVAQQSKFVYVSNDNANTVSGYSLDPTTGIPTPLAGSPYGAGSSPYGIAACRLTKGLCKPLAL